MIKIGSQIKILDNSGGKKVKCFHLKKKNTNKSSTAGLCEIIKGSIIHHIPHKKVSKKQKVNVILVLIKRKKRENNGNFFNYERNTGILINEKGMSIGTRIKTRISRIFKKRKIKKKMIKIKINSKRIYLI